MYHGFEGAGRRYHLFYDMAWHGAGQARAQGLRRALAVRYIARYWGFMVSYV